MSDESTLRLVAALIKAGKRFQFLMDKLRPTLHSQSGPVPRGLDRLRGPYLITKQFIDPKFLETLVESLFELLLPAAELFL